MRRLFLMVVMLMASPATLHAGQLYRCVAAGGAVSYQASACAAGQRQTRTIHYVAQPDSRPKAVPAREPPRTRAGRQTNRPRSSATPFVRAPVNACAAARATRDVELERLGLRRTFDDLSRIDARVRRACRGY